MPRRNTGSRPRPPTPMLPPWPGLLASVAASALGELRTSVGLWVGTSTWLMIHESPTMGSFEEEHGAGARRWSYNGRCFAEVERTRTTFVGEHAGFHDLFEPI